MEEENKIIIKLNYKDKEEEYSCKDDDLLSVLLTQFATSKNKKIEDFIFYFENSEIKYENNITIKDSFLDKQEMKIFNISVKDKIQEEKKEEKSNNEIQQKEKNETKEEQGQKNNIEYYDDIVCPMCNTTAIIDKNDKNELSLNILNCNNFHSLKNINFDIYNTYSSHNLQNTDSLKCDICNTLKKQLTKPDNKFYICSCGIKLCSGCYKTHIEEGHHKIEYENRNYLCLVHNKKFVSYCLDCNTNLCEDCEDWHENHENIGFCQVKPINDQVDKLSQEINKQKMELKDFVENMKKTFNDIIKTVENYLNNFIKIDNTFINKFNSGYWNYQLLRNLTNQKLFKNKMINFMSILKQEKELHKKAIQFITSMYIPINNLLSIKEKINMPQNKTIKTSNIAIIIYQILDSNPIDKRVKLFDPIFVTNNKDKLSMEIDGKKEKELSSYYLNSSGKSKLKVTIKEEGNIPVTDMSYMLNNCKNLISVDFSKWNTCNITAMEGMFQLCPLKEIPDISKFNTQNLENIRAMFSKCTQITSIPDMSKWFNNKDNVLKNISMLFNGCKNLTIINFPKWYTNKLEDMSYLFNRCINLKEINNLGKLITDNVKNMSGIFNHCEKLINIPSLSWNTHNVENMNNLFQSCSSIEKINDINKWNTKNVKYMNGLFSMCSKLKTIPNIGKWSTENVEEMVGMFNECISLENIPDLGKWNVANVNNASAMFYKCEKLKTLPNGLNNWKFKKNVILEKIFEKCPCINRDDIMNNWKKS